MNEPCAGSDPEFESIVDSYYGDVYRFALSLARQPAAASDLTQETFLRFAQKRGQIRDRGRIKAWLMTTVFREFTGDRRRAVRFPHDELDACEADLPVVGPDVIQTLDGESVLRALAELDECFRAPLALFFLEDFAYQEIAEILGIPIGTVMSRLSRGKAQLKRALSEIATDTTAKPSKILRLPSSTP